MCDIENISLAGPAPPEKFYLKTFSQQQIKEAAWPACSQPTLHFNFLQNFQIQWKKINLCSVKMFKFIGNLFSKFNNERNVFDREVGFI